MHDFLPLLCLAFTRKNLHSTQAVPGGQPHAEASVNTDTLQSVLRGSQQHFSEVSEAHPAMKRTAPGQ